MSDATNAETYFRDHWIDIDAERFDRYLQMFRITDTNRPIYFDPLGAQPGETVVDFGCGPGDVALELAKVVGPSGVVHGIDLTTIARPAFSDLNIGRHLRGHLHVAGFRNLTTKVSAFVDDQGVFIHTLHNFFGYAKAVRTLSDAQLADMAGRAMQAIDDGTWLFLMNFFQVNGVR